MPRQSAEGAGRSTQLSTVRTTQVRARAPKPDHHAAPRDRKTSRVVPHHEEHDSMTTATPHLTAHDPDGHAVVAATVDRPTAYDAAAAAVEGAR